MLAALVAWRWWLDGQTTLGSRTLEAIKEFKDKLTPVAKKVQEETGISAKLGIVQAALESANGTSDLSRPTAKLIILPANTLGPANNLFGFKTGEAWLKAGRPHVMIPTWDYYKKGQKMPDGNVAAADGQKLKWPAAFRAYASWDDSYRDWARLMQVDMYVKDGALDALKKGDLKAFGTALGIHYAPNQDYVSRLSSRANVIGDVA